MSLPTYKEVLSPETYEGLRNLVRQTFPDRKAPAPSDGLVDMVVASLPAEARVALGIAKEVGMVAVSSQLELSQALGEARGVAQEDARGTAQYYVAKATHTRYGQGKHEFTAELPVVRIQLPESTPTDFQTEWGTVYAGDHKVHTVELVRDKYGEFFEAEIGSVFLTTPARHFGARFAAIATYEVLDKAGKLTGWILEAGMATGEAMVLYASPNCAPIVRRAWYQPTPFSSDQNFYRGDAHFRQNGGPLLLNVQVFTPEERGVKTCHLEVSVLYDTYANPGDKRLFPAALTAEAALRVAAIAVAKGSSDPLFNILAPFASALSWVQAP